MPIPSLGHTSVRSSAALTRSRFGTIHCAPARQSGTGRRATIADGPRIDAWSRTKAAVNATIHSNRTITDPPPANWGRHRRRTDRSVCPSCCYCHRYAVPAAETDYPIESNIERTSPVPAGPVRTRSMSDSSDSQNPSGGPHRSRAQKTRSPHCAASHRSTGSPAGRSPQITQIRDAASPAPTGRRGIPAFASTGGSGACRLPIRCRRPRRARLSRRRWRSRRGTRSHRVRNRRPDPTAS